METKFLILGYISILIVGVGWIIAYTVGKNTKKFNWTEYALLALPTLVVTVMLANHVDIRVLDLYVRSALVGFSLEYLLGLAYHQTLNERMWTYTHFDVHGYTSFLTLPFWGLGGVIFWMLSKIVGL